MNMMMFLEEIKEPKVSELGGKGYSLAVLINNGFNVPQGFVITSDAFFKFLKANNLMVRIGKLALEIDENTFGEKSKEIRDLILEGNMPEDIASEIGESLNKLNAQYASIRSSAISEDSLKASFAGLHDTFLNIKSAPELVLENVKKCWASLFNERAVVYRIKKEIPHLEGMAVVIQEMIPAEISGTAFTAHPDTGDKNEIIIESSWGLGESIVSGLVTPDRYIVNKKNFNVIKKIIGRKKITVRTDKGGIARIDTPDDKMNAFSLRDTSIENITKVCLNIEKAFKYPQDIEWCIHKNKIWILQSRAITSLGDVKDA
jgi:pyruvate,water dikinase